MRMSCRRADEALDCQSDDNGEKAYDNNAKAMPRMWRAHAFVIASIRPIRGHEDI